VPGAKKISTTRNKHSSTKKADSFLKSSDLA